MHTLKKAAVAGMLAIAGVFGTAGVSHAWFGFDNDTRKDTLDAEGWMLYAANEVNQETNIWALDDRTTQEQREERADHFADHGYDTTDITWGEFVDILEDHGGYGGGLNYGPGVNNSDGSHD